MGGRVITGARSSLPQLGVARLLGCTVTRVDSRGKNLLITFVSPENNAELVLHTHMRMTGSWHVYPADVAWQRPERQARVVLEATMRIAVCFNAPVVELATPSDTAHRSSLSQVGPDILVEPLDLDGMRRRVARTDPDRALGELLLDQRVVAGIGNIYRCESLFLQGLHPWTPRRALSDAALDQLLTTASTLMRSNLGAAGSDAVAAATNTVARQFSSGPNEISPSGPWVYRRAGLPCWRCASIIQSIPQGEQARVAYWCPSCQPAPLGAGGARAV